MYLVCVRVAVLIALFPLLVGLAVADQKQGKRYALIVGVNDYSHRDLTALRFAENDGRELAELLQKGGFEVRYLSNTQEKKDRKTTPTAENVRAELDQLLQGKGKNDLVLIALFGHGVRLEVDDPEDKGKPRTFNFFCPSDADLLGVSYATGRSKTLINLDDLLHNLGKCGAGTRLLVVDACRNELKARGSTRTVDSSVLRIPEGVAALFSCARGERAWESAKLEHGVFCYFVLRGLRGAAVNEEGAVTWDRLGEYVKARVSAETGEIIGDGAKQSPHGVGSLVGASPVLLRRANTLANGVGMTLVRVQSGKFLIGSPKEEKLRDDDEAQHEVQITRGFLLGSHEVTQKQFRIVMEKNPSHFRTPGKGADRVKGVDTDELPVESVTWEQAVEFCKRLSALASEKNAGRIYRLPTEAEWEYACRAGTKTAYHTGTELSTKQANFDREGGRPVKVASHEPNAWGLYDMHGNVAEWCHDHYAADAYARGIGKDPKGPAAGELRVVRGGGWLGGARSCRSAARGSAAPTAAASHVGFRVACNVRE